jgi:hypothetical protein
VTNPFRAVAGKAGFYRGLSKGVAYAYAILAMLLILRGNYLAGTVVFYLSSVEIRLSTSLDWYVAACDLWDAIYEVYGGGDDECQDKEPMAAGADHSATPTERGERPTPRGSRETPTPTRTTGEGAGGTS